MILKRTEQDFERHDMPPALVEVFPTYLWSAHPSVSVEYLTMPPSDVTIDELADIAWGFYAEGVSRSQSSPRESEEMLLASHIYIEQARSWGVEV